MIRVNVFRNLEDLKVFLFYAIQKGKKIATIDNESIQKQLSGEGEVPSIASIKKSNLPITTPIKRTPSTTSSGSSISNEAAAIAWAKSIGYPVPTKMGGCLSTFLVVLGLCAYVIPGVILLLLVWNNGRQYERDMKALIEKWIDAGKPEPGMKTRPVEQLEKIEEKPAAPPSTESRLEELVSMKEKGLISQEEYETLRKKALGL